MIAAGPAAGQPVDPAPVDVRALEPGAPPAAATRYRTGVELYRAGRFLEAAHEFRVGLELAPASAKLAFNLARALERAGRMDEAIAAYRTYLTRHPDAPDKTDIDGTITALERIVQERPTAVTVTTTPGDALIVVDEAPAAAGRTPLEIALRPGRHRLTLRVPGRVDEVREVDVPAAPNFAVSFELSDPAASGQPAAPTLPALDASDGVGSPTSARPEWVPYVGWSAVGVGAAGLVAGALFHSDARASADEASALGRAERARYDALSADVDSANTAAVISFAVGAALVGGGVGVLLWPFEGVHALGVARVTATPGQVIWRHEW